MCKNENTRKVHNTAYESRNQENIALLEEVSNDYDVYGDSKLIIFSIIQHRPLSSVAKLPRYGLKKHSIWICLYLPIAQVLGYKSHAAYVLEVKMAKTVEAVETVGLEN